MQSTIQTIIDEKIIVIVRGVERDKLLPLANALYDGGIRLMEITFDSTGKVLDEQTADNIKMIVDALGDKMLIGAGTVLTPKQVELTKNAGGKFIISPDTRAEVIQKTKELGLVSMPGALTPTEVQSAHLYGADFVKLFPIANLGVGYFKAVKAPLSHIKFLAVGGVDLSNVKEFLSAGVRGFGIGSNVIDKKAIKENRFDYITDLANKYVQAVKE